MKVLAAIRSRTSTPNLRSCRPFVQLTLSVTWYVFCLVACGPLGLGPSCTFRSFWIWMFGKTSSPGKWKLGTAMSSLYRLYARRNSFDRLARKVWNSDSENRCAVVGRGKKKIGRLAAVLMAEVLLST